MFKILDIFDRFVGSNVGFSVRVQDFDDDLGGVLEEFFLDLASDLRRSVRRHSLHLEKDIGLDNFCRNDIKYWTLPAVVVAAADFVVVEHAVAVGAVGQLLDGVEARTRVFAARLLRVLALLPLVLLALAFPESHHDFAASGESRQMSSDQPFLYRFAAKNTFSHKKPRSQNIFLKLLTGIKCSCTRPVLRCLPCLSLRLFFSYSRFSRFCSRFCLRS